MDRVTKFLKKLSKRDRKTIQIVIEQLYADDTKSLDIKKLKGGGNLFRVRRGNVRIVYSLYGSNIVIVKIEFRNEATYR